MASPRTCDNGVRVMHYPVQLSYLMVEMARHAGAKTLHSRITGPNESTRIGMFVGVMLPQSEISFLTFEFESLTS